MRKRIFALYLALALGVAPGAGAEVARTTLTGPPGYLVVEVLDDDLFHFEVSAVGDAPAADARIYTSPMILETGYDGPDEVTIDGTTIETPQLRARIDLKTSASASRTARRRASEHALPRRPAPALQGDRHRPGPIDAVYGLGQQFKNPGSADGDWTVLGVRRGEGLLGNGFPGFEGGAVGNVQIPVLYALGDGRNFALMMDNVYQQSWDFTTFWWQARMFGDQLRFYVMAGPDLPDLRADYLELTGRPPVPPRKAFGLWVSEFGYDDWGEIDALRDGLRAAGFPIDGFVLDLNWFGGVVLGDPGQSEMGRLDWDRDQEPRLQDNPYQFPDPAGHVAAYAADQLGLVAIEESYLADTTGTFAEMPDALTAWRRTDGRCDPTRQVPVTGVEGFWGVGRMIDWTDPGAGAGSTNAAARRTLATSASPPTGLTWGSPRTRTKQPAMTASSPARTPIPISTTSIT